MVKVIIVHPSQFTQRWYDYYCIEAIEKCFDVEFWDCSDITTPSFKTQSPLKTGHLREVHSLSELLAKVKLQPKDTVLISEIHNNESNKKIHEILSWYFPYKLHLGFYSNTQNTPLSTSYKVLNSVRNIAANKFLVPLRTFITNCKNNQFFFDRIIYRNDKEYLLKKSLPSIGYKYTFKADCKKGSFHRINHPDFETYLNIKDGDKILSNKFIVYIDDYYPHHPEFIKEFLPEEIQTVATDFYNSMNNYFDSIEKKYNCPVVVAAHPYANYDSFNPFQNRLVLKFKTAELVRDSFGVLIHGSNAFSYVVLFQKPVALLYNRAFYKIDYLKTRMEACSYNFHQPLSNTDDINNSDNLELHNIDDNFRYSYIDNYLGDINNPKSNKILFIEIIKEFYNLINVKLDLK